MARNSVKKEKGLNSWHLLMMALGTVIGGSFFLGSSVAINAAGPSIIISFVLGGILVYFILLALSELTVANPHYGSFRTFAAEAFGAGTGFVVGWIYWTGMVLAMSSEATAVSIFMRQWIPDLSIPITGSIVIIGITLLNLLGADKLSTLESGLAAVKILAVFSFIIIGAILILGLFPGIKGLGVGELAREPFAAGGLKGIAGSMLIVMFTYAGFEIIGLAASEADDPVKTIPKAISLTIFSLVGLYILSIIILLPLVPTSQLNESTSPLVAALEAQGIGWAAAIINLVLITAILSTSLASMFGLGRMMRSLVDEGHAPIWLKDTRDVPYRGILFSGLGTLIGLGFGLLLPRVYLFLVSSSGFALLFTYVIIMAAQIRLRKRSGCPPLGKCQVPWYPYSSWIVLISLLLVIASMPFIAGQGSGLIAGLIILSAFFIIYLILRTVKIPRKSKSSFQNFRNQSGFSEEYGSMENDDPTEE